MVNGQYPVAAQNLADGFMAAPVAKLLHFPLDAIIPPAILASELEHQLNNQRLNGWSSDFLRLLIERPLGPDKLALPAE